MCESDQDDHDGHDVQPYAEAFPDASGKVNAGIGWCNDCETEVAPDRERPARVI